jgi:hypothetical protein
MTTYSLNPTYYQVTWNQDSPSDYSGLAGNQAGGLDYTSALNYNRLVTITGTQSLSGSPLDDGDWMIINGYRIDFAGSDDFNTICTKINLASKFTGIIADGRVEANYLSLTNAPGYEGSPFYIADSNVNTLSDLGLTAGQYGAYPSLIGSTYSTINGGNVVINGINIVWTHGGVTLPSAVSYINSYTQSTSVVAAQAGQYLQLSSTLGQPFVINSGNVVSNLGITTTSFGGYPSTITLSQNKERANMRWQQVVNELESFSTPFFLGNVYVTGNVVGNDEVTTISFTIGYEHPDQISTVARPEEPDAGTVYSGTAAIKRSVARAMVNSMVSNRKVFDPTLAHYSAYADRPNVVRIQTLTAQGVDTITNIVTVEGNIEVVQVPGV